MSVTSPPAPHRVWRDLRRTLAFRNISAIYIFAAMVVLFSILTPDTFPTLETVRVILTDQALTAILAIGLVIPLAAGAFDLSIGSQLGLGAIIVAWLLAFQDLGLWASVGGTLLVGAGVGLINGLLIVKAKISSFITTLGMSSVILAAISWISHDAQITDLGSDFQKVATHEVFGISTAVYLMVVLAVAVWYVLDNTHLGRAVHATGGQRQRGAAGRRAHRHGGHPQHGRRLVARRRRRCPAQLVAGDRRPHGRPRLHAAGVRGRVPRFHAVPQRPLQRARHSGRGVRPRDRRQRAPAGGAPVWIPELFNGVALLLAVAVTRLRKSADRTRKSRTPAAG
ncbi:ABC transporter permease [Actinomadura madurae]|nr:ABC transporter permease [Actinomadura madurae]MCQ0014462.1 ABC transporter permease [Actinomadura madurae]